MAQHFLQRTTINTLSIQNILSKVDTENEENVLKETKESYEILINSVDSKGSANVFYGENRYERRDRSHSEARFRRRDEKGRDEKRNRTRSRSVGFRERGRSRSKSKGRGRNYNRGGKEDREKFDNENLSNYKTNQVFTQHLFVKSLNFLIVILRKTPMT